MEVAGAVQKRGAPLSDIVKLCVQPARGDKCVGMPGVRVNAVMVLRIRSSDIVERFAHLAGAHGIAVAFHAAGRAGRRGQQCGSFLYVQAEEIKIMGGILAFIQNNFMLCIRQSLCSGKNKLRPVPLDFYFFLHPAVDDNAEVTARIDKARARFVGKVDSSRVLKGFVGGRNKSGKLFFHGR